jgi:lipopolysaccharide export system protein LptC
VKKFSLPTFTPEGPRSMLLRGEEARFKTAQQIDITEMQLTLFDGKPDEKVDTVFVSAAATFFPSRQVAEGDKGVRIVRPDVEMYGEKWIYEHQRKKVVIDGRVRVIFRAQLKDILK